MFAALHLSADLPLVIGAQQPRVVVADGHLGGRANERQGPERLRRHGGEAGEIVDVAWRREIAGARVVVPRVDEAADAHIPQCVGGRGMRQVAEGDRRDRRVGTKRGFEWPGERWLFGVDPRLVVNAVDQLPSRRQLRGYLCEHLVLLVASRLVRIGAGLAVVITQILIAAKEPHALSDHRPSETGREIAVFGALVSGLTGWRSGEGADNRLARERRRLAVVRRVVGEALAALPGDDVDHGPLNVAEFRRCPHRLDLDFLYEVSARFRPRDAVARAREVGAVDEELVFVRARPERRYGGDGSARG